MDSYKRFVERRTYELRIFGQKERYRPRTRSYYYTRSIQLLPYPPTGDTADREKQAIWTSVLENVYRQTDGIRNYAIWDMAIIGQPKPYYVIIDLDQSNYLGQVQEQRTLTVHIPDCSFSAGWIKYGRIEGKELVGFNCRPDFPCPSFLEQVKGEFQGSHITVSGPFEKRIRRMTLADGTTLFVEAYQAYQPAITATDNRFINRLRELIETDRREQMLQELIVALHHLKAPSTYNELCARFPQIAELNLDEAQVNRIIYGDYHPEAFAFLRDNLPNTQVYYTNDGVAIFRYNNHALWENVGEWGVATYFFNLEASKLTLAEIAELMRRIDKQDLWNNKANVALLTGYLGRVIHDDDLSSWKEKVKKMIE